MRLNVLKNSLWFVVLLLVGCVTIGNSPSAQELSDPFKVLTLNLCVSWSSPQQDRANQVVEFVKAQRVDVLLLEEGSGGLTQFNAIKYIAERLGYSYCQVPAFGVPGFYTFNIGIVAKSPVTNPLPLGCQVAGGDPIDMMPFPGASRGLQATVDGIQFWTVHLTAPVTQESREQQVQCLVAKLPTGPIVWGGDFNFSRSDMAYPLVPLVEAMYPGEAQVDMVFSRGLTVVKSELVFTDKVVSDHCGVLVTFQK
jgi:hypothetical protein